MVAVVMTAAAVLSGTATTADAASDAAAPASRAADPLVARASRVADPLVASWRMNESAGSRTMIDSSGHGLRGAIGREV
ncbi:MAG TPA: hypothetical protein VFR35_04285, partial [Actinoplanes sp.]|nr:hypothetical protein [Actinoplanes sp.]